MSETTTIQVEWISKVGGGYNALATEDKGGYLKGTIISTVPFQMKHFPSVLCILVKQQHQTI